LGAQNVQPEPDKKSSIISLNDGNNWNKKQNVG